MAESTDNTDSSLESNIPPPTMPSKPEMPVQTESHPTKMKTTTSPDISKAGPEEMSTNSNHALSNGNGQTNGMAKRQTRKDYEDWLQDSEHDEYAVPDLRLIYQDPEHQQNTLSSLNTLRKGAQFCDVFLEIDGREIAGHRAVLACASVYLFELFRMEAENVCPAHFKLEGFDYDSLNILVEYAYTSKLEVPEEKVKAVYRTATMLKMARAAEACSVYLAEHLTPNNCLGTRAFANSNFDLELTKHTDAFIQTHMNEIAECAELKSLPFIQINIIGVEEKDKVGDNKKNLCEMVINWVAESYHSEQLKELYDDLRVLYLTSDNTLRDCHDVKDEFITGTTIVQDYKMKDKHRKKNHVQKKERKGERQPQLGWKKSGGGKWAQPEKSSVVLEWKLVSFLTVGDKGCLCLAFLGDRLTRLSLNFLPMPVNSSKDSSPQGSPPHSVSPRGSVCEKLCSLTPLARMGSARCGVGAAVLDGRLVALGGYDRGECLNTVETYNIAENVWSPMAPMLSPRGRFDVTQIAGKLFACGGSNGSVELRTAEYYDKGKWIALPNMRKPRSSAGVAMLSDIVYVVGGWSGQSGLADCERYDPKHPEKGWQPIARLNTGRSQATVCGLAGRLIVVGGCDAWNCINTVEEYDPISNSWSYLPNMTSCRRGAGTAVFKGKLYVVGGSDGTMSLPSVEVYDPDTRIWSLVPPMSVPRANVGVVVFNDKLFAVGGFSGKEFLDSVEYLGEGFNEWCSFLPVEAATS